MSFAPISSDFLVLRKRLLLAIGANAMTDITIAQPTGDDEELSFIRLVAWAYVLLHESGKISLNFLRRLPPWQGGELLPYVRALRTWTSHNLSFDREVDVQTMRISVQWFAAACGVGTPTNAVHWKKCFEKLSTDLHSVIKSAILTCDLFDDPVDGNNLKKELQEKLDRNWDAHKFDRYAEAVFERLGYSGFDVVAFRNRHLNNWRQIVSASTPDQIDRNLTIRIESDILRSLMDALPVSIEEFDKLIVCENSDSLLIILLILIRQPAAERRNVLFQLEEALRIEADGQPL
ncbi:MAG: hypothetical protein V4582_18120 [Pseudomonadota bacterium]